MVDGVYTFRGREPLPPEGAPAGARRVPMRRVVAFWGALCLGVALLGMTIGGFIKRRKRRKA